MHYTQDRLRAYFMSTPGALLVSVGENPLLVVAAATENNDNSKNYNPSAVIVKDVA
ncbi:MAG: hypothetical protein J6D20_06700 [Clostridia bacterium]|nr:hypothetical protein [Clostridia bacterium]